jgi:hypothetical protein
MTAARSHSACVRRRRRGREGCVKGMGVRVVSSMESASTRLTDHAYPSRTPSTGRELRPAMRGPRNIRVWAPVGGGVEVAYLEGRTPPAPPTVAEHSVSVTRPNGPLRTQQWAPQSATERIPHGRCYTYPARHRGGASTCSSTGTPRRLRLHNETDADPKGPARPTPRAGFRTATPKPRT